MENLGRETKKIYKFSFFRQKTRKTIARTARIVVLFIDNFKFSNSNSRAENILEQLYCYRSFIYNANILIYEILFVKRRSHQSESCRRAKTIKSWSEKIQLKNPNVPNCLCSLFARSRSRPTGNFIMNILSEYSVWPGGVDGGNPSLIRLTRILPS